MLYLQEFNTAIKIFGQYFFPYYTVYVLTLLLEYQQEHLNKMMIIRVYNMSNINKYKCSYFNEMFKIGHA